MLDFFTAGLPEIDPDVHHLIGYEAERQARKLILIPSESQAPEAVREALGSVFQNIYAEGYPDPATHWLSQEQILDYELQLATYRRNSDQRYYKGVEYVNILEALARRRAAEAFAANGFSANDIWANVQPLSGSPANSAVYDALVAPGDVVMGMNLLHGGHLTHGSPVNRSGRHYKIISYGVDPKTERLNMDEIEALALQHKPKMIIAGFTSYPWMPDWAHFRAIADKAGAYLLADISHIAGMVAAGVVPSPIGHAHAISFTTHKTLYGPRGACLLSTDKKIAEKLDAAVFPGEQGGPHVNTIAGMAVAFKLARTPEFFTLQQQVKDNAAHMAAELQRHGLRIPYGGTDTHMLLVDLKNIRATGGVSPDGKKGTPLMGDPAARILDLAGIVLNRNTIPGDKSARSPSGIRIGTPWITQRGFGLTETARLAEIIARVLKACKPTAFAGRYGPVYHARIDFDVLEDAKRDVMALAKDVDLPANYEPGGYPHHYFMHKQTKDPGGEYDVIEIEGVHARGFCNVAMTNDAYLLKPGEYQPTWVLEPDGRPMSPGVLKRTCEATSCFQLMVPKENEPRVAHWLRALSDGFVTMDPKDPFLKAPGPVVVRRLSHTLVESWPKDIRPPAPETFEKDDTGWAFHKSFWIGHRPRAAAPGGLRSLPEFTWAAPANLPILRTRLNETHRKLGAKMVPFAGYDMPVQYTSVLEEHQTVRNAAGLFDVSHMGLFEFSGENVHLFLQTVTANDVTTLKIGGSQYSFLLAHDGSVIDDIWVYRLGPELYWMVVNAANNDKDWAWLKAVREAQVMIDPARPWTRALGYASVAVRDLRDPQWGDAQRVQLALQGPKSRSILAAMAADDEATLARLMDMQRTQIAHGAFLGYDVWFSRTGYTGEPMAFELFLHPDDLPGFWRDVLRAGASFGAKPIGLAARDSLRIEAGLPLYGHELAGPLNLNPADSGFAPYVKLYKPFFIGKAAYEAHEATRQARLARFMVDEERGPMLGQGDVVVNAKGRVVGHVTSCSIDGTGRQVGLAYLQDPNWQRGTKLGVYRLGNRNWEARTLDQLQPGDRIQLPDAITIIDRFLNKQ